jgi:TPM domain
MILTHLTLLLVLLCVLQVDAANKGWKKTTFPEASCSANGLCDPDSVLPAAGAIRYTFAHRCIEVRSTRSTDSSSFYSIGSHNSLSQSMMMVHCRVEAQLVKLTGAFESPCGNTHEPVEAGVALVQRMTLEKGANLNDQASTFAEHLHNAWGIGHAGCSNGLLLFLSLEDRAFALSVGEGLDSILTQQRRQAVLDSMKPALRAGDTVGGIEAALRKVHDIFSKHLPAATPRLGRQPSAAAGKKSAAARKLMLNRVMLTAVAVEAAAAVATADSLAPCSSPRRVHSVLSSKQGAS